MESVVLACRLQLAMVFVLAGLAKLVDGTGTRQTVGSILPVKVALPVAGFLPIVELAVGIALLQSQWAWRASVAAIPLLLLFTAVTAHNVARRTFAGCGCFGSKGGSAVAALVRNEVLLALAALVVWQGRTNAGPDALSWLRSQPPITLAVQLLLLAALALIAEWTPLVPKLPHAIIRFSRRLADRRAARNAPPVAPRRSQLGFPRSGLPVGTRAPALQLDQVDSTALTLTDFQKQGHAVLVIFAEPGCASCATLRSTLVRWTDTNRNRVALVTAGGEGCACDGRAQQARREYQVPAVPSAVLIDADGRIASHLAVGPAAIELLAHDIAATQSAHSRKGLRATAVVEYARRSKRAPAEIA